MTNRRRSTGRMRPNDSRSFLKNLKSLLAIRTQAQFANMCGKQEGHMSKYLNGNQEPGIRALQGCLVNATVSKVFEDPPDQKTHLGKEAKKLRDRVIAGLFGNQIRAFKEVATIPKYKRTLPTIGGVYVLYDSAGNVLYLGKAKNIRSEVWQTLDRPIPIGLRLKSNLKKVRYTIRDLARYVSLYQIENELLRHNIEALLIRVFINQTHNSNIGNFKS